MNYLAHLFLSPRDDESIMGNLMGDFMNGTPLESLPPTVQAGVRAHRAIDAYTDDHPEVRDLRTLFSPQRRRFAGIILDVAFDHYLLKHWDRFSAEALEDFLQRVYASLERGHSKMPKRMAGVVSSMLNHRWLDTYRQLDGVGYALDRMATRLRIENSLPGSIEEVQQNDASIDAGFQRFFPELQSFAATLNSPQ